MEKLKNGVEVAEERVAPAEQRMERGRMGKRVKVVLVVLILLGLLAAGIGWRVYENLTAVPAQSIDELQRETGVPVEVYVVEPEDVLDTVPLSGGIEAQARVAIRPMVSEEIVEILVETGERVERGQLLVRLDSTDAEIALANAEAALAQAQSELEKLRNGTRPEEIAAAEARLREAEAVVTLRRQEYERQQALHEEEVTELAMLEQAQSQYHAAEALAAAARANYELLVAGPRAEDIAAAEAAVRLAQANVARQERQVAEHRLVSPLAGVVTTNMLEEGDLVDVRELIFEVLAIDEVQLVVELSEVYRPLVAEGMVVKVTVDALGGEEFAGTVEEINPAARREDRSFRTEIRLDNSAGRLYPGMYGRAHVVTRQIEGALMAPADAVRQDGVGEYVLVVGEDSVVERVAVETGETFGRMVRVTQGLEAGTRVVVLADVGVGEGTVVRVVER